MADEQFRFYAAAGTYVNDAYEYIIPAVQDWDSNFGDAESRTVRIPNMDGGLDQYGTQRAPSKIGKVTLNYSVVVDDPDDMRTEVNKAYKTMAYGRQMLYYRPQGSASELWTYARVVDVNMRHKSADGTGRLRQDVRMVLECRNPHWFGSLVTVTNAASPPASSSANLTNPGTDLALVKVTVTGATHFDTITITNNDLGGQAVVYDHGSDAGASKVLVVDSATKAVTFTGESNPYSKFTFDHPGWLRLLPGVNTVAWVATYAFTSIKFEYYPAYR